MDEKKRQVWRFIIQTAISILTAIATALGVTSCMAAVQSRQTTANMRQQLTVRRRKNQLFYTTRLII